MNDSESRVEVSASIQRRDCSDIFDPYTPTVSINLICSARCSVIEGHRLQVVTLTLSLLLVTSTVLAQGANGSIKGRATDSAGGVLPGAIVTVTPKGGSTVTDNQGE